jgi:hypothetical protein
MLKAGAEVYEYQPAMIHTKVLCVDGSWSVVGSTNFDNRSRGINDELESFWAENEYGAPEKIRTSDLQLRRLPLYPAELRARSSSLALIAAG